MLYLLKYIVLAKGSSLDCVFTWESNSKISRLFSRLQQKCNVFIWREHEQDVSNADVMKNWKIQEGLSRHCKQYLLPLISLFTKEQITCLNYWGIDVLKINENGSFQTPQSLKTYYIHVYILHQAVFSMPDLFFSVSVWLLANSSINLYKLNDFLPSIPTTNVFQGDRLHSEKLPNGVYNKCFRSQWTEKMTENSFTNSERLMCD